MEQPLKMSDLQIVLLGKTGSGKSASGNTILGEDRNPFKKELSAEPVTRRCESAQTEVRTQRITVIDTVGLTDKTNTEIQSETMDIFQYACNGVDVFLLVMKLGNRLTDQEQKVVQSFNENFGGKASTHTLVLFTHGDSLPVSIEEFLKKSILLRSLVNQYSGRYHVFDNKDKNQDQVIKLIEKIESLVSINQNSRYTLNDYEKAQNELLHKKCAAGAAKGGAIGAVGGAIAAKIGLISLTVVKSALAGGAIAAVAVYLVKLYFLKGNLSKRVGKNSVKNK